MKLKLVSHLEELLSEIKRYVDQVGNKKVDKVSGKGLSTNDLTNELKSNYDAGYSHSQEAHAPSDAQKNVQSDWNATSGDALILNKPTDNSQFSNGAGYITGIDEGMVTDALGYIPSESDHKHTKDDITDLPDVFNLATVATTGSYNDLIDKPTALPADGGNASTSDSLNAIEIRENADLNNLKTCGYYVCKTVAVAATLTNSPLTNKTFFLEVGMASSYAYQRLTTSNYQVFHRTAASATTWNPWVETPSVADKTKLDGIEIGATKVTTDTVANWGFTKNPGTITSIKMNGVTKGVSGDVDLGTVVTDVSGKENTSNKVTSISSASTDTQYPSAKAVYQAIEDLPEPMIFKGSLGTGGTITTLPAAAKGNTGFTYKVITNGTYASIAAKVGDTFISDGTKWVLIPSGDEPSGTVTSVGMTVPTGLSVSGSPITSSGTLAVSLASGYSIPTTAKQTAWDGKATSTDITNAINALDVAKIGSDTEYITSVTETDGKISATKKTFPAIPSKLSDLTADATHRVVTDAEKTVWNAKADKTDLDKTNIHLTELKVLGWSVPDEMTISNTVENGVFHQKIGRVDLGSYDWSSKTMSNGRILFNSPENTTTKINAKASDGYVTPMYVKTGWTPSYQSAPSWAVNSIIMMSAVSTYNPVAKSIGVVVNESEYSNSKVFKQAMQAVYLYYELEKEILIPIDGNEKDVQLEEDLDLNGYSDSAGGRNLLDIADTVFSRGAYLFQLNNLNFAPGDYTVSFELSNNTFDHPQSQMISDSGSVNKVANLKNGLNYFTITSTSQITDLRLYINSAGTVSNFQFEKGSTAHTYRPYIKSNRILTEELDLNGYGDEAGGRNLLNENTILHGYYNTNGDFTQNSEYIATALNPIKSSTTYKIFCKKGPYLGRVCWYDINKNFISTRVIMDVTSVQVNSPSNAEYIGFDCRQTYGSTYTYDIVLTEDLNLTDYVPYIKSNKMLGDEISILSDAITDVKFLGWSVPEQMSLRNYVDGDGKFHQRIGRVDMSTLTWYSASERFYADNTLFAEHNNNHFNHLYTAIDWLIPISGMPNKSIKMTGGTERRFFIRDDSFTSSQTIEFENSLKGIYLYYELANEIVISEGNEALTVLNAKLNSLDGNNMLF